MDNLVTKKIGIMGGTFDPIHTGHLIIAESVREALKLDEILFIPSKNPPHKNTANIADGKHRLEMVKLAVSGNRFFKASDIEMNREGKTYSLHTLEQLAGIYGAGADLVFIIGADTVWDLENWYEFRDVFRLCTFAVVSRPGFGEKSLKSKIEQLSSVYGAKIKPVEAPLMDISSSDIRKKVMNGESIAYLVPDCVRDYIVENRIYQYRGGSVE